MFKVRYTGSADMGAVEILEPEQVSGITARVSFPDCELEYDGVAIEAGSLTGDGLSPVQALPVLLGQWTDGYAVFCDYDTVGGIKYLLLETEITDEATQRTWFDPDTLLPLRSEIYGSDGKMVVAVSVDNIELKAL